MRIGTQLRVCAFAGCDRVFNSRLYRKPNGAEYSIALCPDHSRVRERSYYTPSARKPRGVVSYSGLPAGSVAIALTKGCVAILDETDVERIGGYSWSTQATGYAGAKIGGRLVLLHRYILDAPVGALVDHINGNRLDNRRANLRFVNRQQHARNSGRRANCTYKGIARSGKQRWSAAITLDGRTTHLGTFGSPEEAALAYDAAAIECFGEYACINGLDPTMAACARRTLLRGDMDLWSDDRRDEQAERERREEESRGE